jgi:preprotein translocase subunit SecA
LARKVLSEPCGADTFVRERVRVPMLHEGALPIRRAYRERVRLSVIDDEWKAHLYDLDHLKASIGFSDLIQEEPDA